jgi:hypothetical protein
MIIRCVVYFRRPMKIVSPLLALCLPKILPEAMQVSMIPCMDGMPFRHVLVKAEQRAMYVEVEVLVAKDALSPIYQAILRI